MTACCGGKVHERAPKETLRRFLATHFDDLAPVMEEIAEQRGPIMLPTTRLGLHRAV